jgi:hypothetical protein
MMAAANGIKLPPDFAAVAAASGLNQAALLSYINTQVCATLMR